MGFVDSFDLYAFNGFDSINHFDPTGTTTLSHTKLGGAESIKNNPITTIDSSSTVSRPSPARPDPKKQKRKIKIDILEVTIGEPKIGPKLPVKPNLDDKKGTGPGKIIPPSVKPSSSVNPNADNPVQQPEIYQPAEESGVLGTAFDFWFKDKGRELTAKEKDKIKDAINDIRSVSGHADDADKLEELLKDGKIIFDPSVLRKGANAATVGGKIRIGTFNVGDRGIDATLVHELGHYTGGTSFSAEPDMSGLMDYLYRKPFLPLKDQRKLEKGFDEGDSSGWKPEWKYLRDRQALPIFVK